MKTFQKKLRKWFALPIMLGVAVVAFFGGIALSNDYSRAPSANAETTEYVNLAEGKTYTAPACGNSYSASLTDGVYADDFNYGDKWYGVLSDTTATDCLGYKTIPVDGTDKNCRTATITIDLEKTELFSKIRLHLYNLDKQNSCKQLSVRTSLDGENWTNLGQPEVQAFTEAEAYWTEFEASESVPARYVQVETVFDGWCFLNEIEVCAKAEATQNNVALNKTVETQAAYKTDGNYTYNYTANLTDGIASNDFNWGDDWFGFNFSDQDSNYLASAWLEGPNGTNIVYARLGTMILDLDGSKQISKVRLHTYNLDSNNKVAGLAVYTSTDKSTWKFQGNPKLANEEGAHWSELSVSETTQYVKVVMAFNGTWGFINEIEVYETVYNNLESCENVVIGEQQAVSSENLAKDKPVYGAPDTLYVNDDTPQTPLSSLTDGVASGGAWSCGYGIDAQTDDGNSLIIDLGETKSWSGVRVHGYVESGSGINKPTAIRVAASNDAIHFTEIGTLTLGETTENGEYWAGVEDVLSTTTSRFVRVCLAGQGWTAIDEIEVYAPTQATPFTHNVANRATVTATQSNSSYLNGYHNLTNGSYNEYGLTWNNSDNQEYGVNTDGINWVTFAFDKKIHWNTVKVHYNVEHNTAYAPKALYVAFSNDREQWTDWTKWETFTDENGGYWVEHTAKSVKSQYIRIGMERTQGYVCIDEVEIYAEKPYENVTLGCEKLALNKTVNAPIGGYGYTANLTDGIASDDWNSGDYWYGLDWDDSRSQAGHILDENNQSKAYGRLGTMIVDLGANTQISKVRAHLYNLKDDTNDCFLDALGVYTSTDNATWTYQGLAPVKNTTDCVGAYWTELSVSVNARYVKVVMCYTKSWGFINEIEVYGAHSLTSVAGSAATVYQEGEKDHYVCSICGATYFYDEDKDEYVVATEDDLRIERLTGFTASNITLNNNLDFNYYAYVGGTPDTVQVEFTLDGGSSILVDGVQEGEEYKFVFKKLGPQNIGRELTAKLLVNGEEKATKPYSAHQYLYSVFQQSDEEGKRLIADIFEYGAAAQTYLGDETTLVNTLYQDVADYKTTFVAPAKTDKNVGVNTVVVGFTFDSVNLKISSEVQMIFKFQAGDNFKLKVNGEDVTNQVTTSATQKVYYTNGISVVHFDQVYTVQLYSGETLVQTAQYSVNSYVYSKHNASNTNLANFVKCLYNYGLSAQGAMPVDRTQDRVNVAKGNTYEVNATPNDNAADNNRELTDGVTGTGTYVAYKAGNDLTITLDLGEQVQGLAAFEWHARQGNYVENNTTFSGVFPNSVTVYVTYDDKTTWTKVGVAYKTEKNQETYKYAIELPYAVDTRYVKFVADATGTTADQYFLVDEVCAFVYSGEAEEQNAYSGVDFAAVLGDVYAPSKDSKDTNLIKNKSAKIEAEGGAIVEIEYDNSGNLKNTPSSSTLMTDGETLSTWDNLTGNTADIHRSGKYFKFNGYNSRRIAYDLGCLCEVNKVTFRALYNTDDGVYVPTVQVYLSSDGETWYKVTDLTPSNPTNKRVHSMSGSFNYVARFVAFEFKVENWVGIDELEVTGKKLSNAGDSSAARIENANLNSRNDKELGIPTAESFGAKNVYLAYHSYSDSANLGGYGPIYQNELEKVVAYTDKDGNMTAPLFDGVLFLLDGPMAYGSYSGAGAAMEYTADSLSWLKSTLLWGNDETLGAQNMNALNNAVQKMKDSDIVGSNYKVKVYISLYYPKALSGDKAFGTYTYEKDSVKESVSDISTADNILKLLKLWIQDFENSFDKSGNLEIGGYYWYKEKLETQDEKTVVNGLKTFLEDKGSKLIWIPYFGAEGVNDWKTHFTHAVLQSNYAFEASKNIQSSRLESAAHIAKSYGMSIEIEMDHKVLTDAYTRARYYEYLARAEKLGYDKSVHFYFFGVSIRDLLNDNSGVGRELYDVTYAFISGDGKLSKPPKLNEVYANATKGADTDITLLTNVTETTEIRLCEPPKHGSVIVNADGTITYRAEEGYEGIVNFTYVYAKNGVFSDICSVTLTVK